MTQPNHTINVGINGFGRIGRNLLRVWLKAGGPATGINITAVNDLSPISTSAHLLKYDTVAGPLGLPVTCEGDEFLIVDGHKIAYHQERNPDSIPWADSEVTAVIESTGFFTDGEKAKAHDAPYVIISAPGTNVDSTVVLGVNSPNWDKHHIISNASCTTNCLAPFAKVLNDKYGIQSGFMTTTHAYTNDQGLLDSPHKDLRRARAGATNIIPTSTGAAKAIGLVIPELQGKLDGHSLRVPVPVGSLTELTAVLERTPESRDEINDALREAAEGRMKGILEYQVDPIVSSDIVGNPHSSIISPDLTKVNGNLVTVTAWYDNEWGYSNRLYDLLQSLRTYKESE